MFHGSVTVSLIGVNVGYNNWEIVSSEWFRYEACMVNRNKCDLICDLS